MFRTLPAGDSRLSPPDTQALHRILRLSRSEVDRYIPLQERQWDAMRWIPISGKYCVSGALMSGGRKQDLSIGHNLKALRRKAKLSQREASARPSPDAGKPNLPGGSVFVYPKRPVSTLRARRAMTSTMTGRTIFSPSFRAKPEPTN